MTYDASNRKDVRRAEKAADIAERNRINYLIAAMGTLQGRVWFHDLLTACHIFADPFTGDALREAHSKGERNVGLRIYTEIVTHCPDHFVTMMKEATIHKEIQDGRRPDPAADPVGADDIPFDDGTKFDTTAPWQ